MKKNHLVGFVFCFLVAYNSVVSQQIKGIILNNKTKEPIVGASVYFNNTTIGTITNDKGYFKIYKNPSIKTDLVISSLGFETLNLNSLSPSKLYKIYLKESINELEEVTISNNDPYTRAEKLAMFKKQFLGNNVEVKHCIIENEDVIKLRYLSKEHKLVAYSDLPILITNQYLGYKIAYTLEDFEVEYKVFHPIKVVYNGLTKFSELPIKKKYKRHRKKTYKGSILHFMRSIYNNTIKENNFGLTEKGMIVNSKKTIHIERKNDLVVVTTRKKRIDLVYTYKRKNLQSFILIDSRRFVINQFGNHVAEPQLIFGGDMGKQHVSKLLPLDYKYKP